MTPTRARNLNNLDPNQIEVRFSDRVRNAFADLEAAVRFSEHFDGDIREVLRDWAEGKRTSVHNVITALPLIAEEAFAHARATKDPRTADAWREICLGMPESGFQLATARRRGRN